MSAQVYSYSNPSRLQRGAAAGAAVESRSTLRHYLAFTVVLGLFVAVTLPASKSGAGSSASVAREAAPLAGVGSLAEGHGFTVQAQGMIAAETGLYSHPTSARPLLLLSTGSAVEIAGQLSVASGLGSHRLLWVRVREGGRLRHGFVSADTTQVSAGNPVDLSPDFLALMSSGADAGLGARGGSDAPGAMASSSTGPLLAAASTAAVSTIAWLPPSVARWWPAIQGAAERHAIDAELVAIVVTVESGGDPQARSHAGATGLMQLMPATAAEVARRLGRHDFALEQLTDPEINLDLGTAYLAQQLTAFGRANDPDWQASVELAAAAYNGGPGMVGAVERGQRGLPAETRSYVSWVGGMWRERRLAESATYSRWWWAGGQRLVTAAEHQLAMLR